MNSQYEHFNSTLISMLGTLPPEAKVHWPEHVSSLVHAYNCTRSTATGYSPYYLLYGRELLLLIDMEFGVKIPSGGQTEHTQICTVIV